MRLCTGYCHFVCCSPIHLWLLLLTTQAITTRRVDFCCTFLTCPCTTEAIAAHGSRDCRAEGRQQGPLGRAGMVMLSHDVCKRVWCCKATAYACEHVDEQEDMVQTAKVLDCLFTHFAPLSINVLPHKMIICMHVCKKRGCPVSHRAHVSPLECCCICLLEARGETATHIKGLISISSAR